jgi:hypothetical protein
MHETQDPLDDAPTPLRQNGATPVDNLEQARQEAAAQEAAAAATHALRCDSCGRRQNIPKELSVRLKSTNGPAAFDTHGGVYRIPIFCDECMVGLLILVRRTVGVIRPESDIATVVMAR